MRTDCVHIFAELGRRLADFGGDPRTAAVVEEAVRANPWFMSGEVIGAARNIARDMLSPDALARWAALYPALPTVRPRRVLVIMAGNVPFVGFQDLLCVLAAGHEAIIKTSSKDRPLMDYVAAQLCELNPGFSILPYTDGAIPDAVIAMGGDIAVGTFREKYAGIPALLRGNRSSAAVLTGGETLAQLAGLAGDILSYSGLGCRNVSLVFVPRGYDLAPLAGALASRRGALNPKYMNNYRHARAAALTAGESFTDCGVCLLCEDASFPAAISRVNYARYDSDAEVLAWLSGHDGEVQCVAGTIRHPRAVAPGETQRPRLTDYPDGKDTMRFLEDI